MSGTRQNVGFPSSQIKGSDWLYSPGCGGLGATKCFLPASFSYIYWPVKVNPFSSFNSLLVLYNETFAPYSDTPIGLCAHNAGSQQEYDVLLFHEEPIGELDRSKAISIIPVPADVTLPFTLEFTGNDTYPSLNEIPQPIDVNYERKIWVVIDMKVTGRMVGGATQVSEAMKTVKLLYEANQ